MRRSSGALVAHARSIAAIVEPSSSGSKSQPVDPSSHSSSTAWLCTLPRMGEARRQRFVDDDSPLVRQRREHERISLREQCRQRARFLLADQVEPDRVAEVSLLQRGELWPASGDRERELAFGVRPRPHVERAEKWQQALALCELPDEQEVAKPRDSFRAALSLPKPG